VPSPKTILPYLLGGAIGAAGIFQGLHWKSTRQPADFSVIENQLRLAGEDNEILRRENEALRSLAQGGGELSVPEELVARIEKEFHLKFRSSPIVHRIPEQEFHDRISASIENRLGPAGIDDRQESYSLIGWLRSDDTLLSQLAAPLAIGCRAWFDENCGEAWMLDKTDLKNIPDQAALLQVLARILLYQHFPPAPAYPGDDAARAYEALHRGAAAGAEARFYAEKALTIGFVPQNKDHFREQQLASLAPFIAGLTSFFQLDGKGRADSLYVTGNAAFQNAFSHPPLTTREIFYPAETVAVPLALELPTPPEPPFLTESAGQLGLRLWLEPLGDAGSALEIPAAWKNDRYILFPDGESSSAVLWDIELDSAATTDQLLPIALRAAAALAGQPEPALPGVALVSAQQRQLWVQRISPTRIRFINAAEAATIAKLTTL
jgi:hypothetical protein